MKTSLHQLPAGLSLIELLVAIAIGVALSFAAVQLFLQSKLAYLQDEEMARVQENGRYALRYLSRELMMAGYLATELPGYRAGTREAGTACFDHLMNTAIALEHINDVSANGTPQAGSQPLPADCLVAGRHQAGTDILLIRRTADSPALFQGERRGAIDRDDIFLGIAGQGGLSGLRRGDEGVTGAMDLWEYLPQLLFLRDYSLTRGDGVPALCRKRLARSSNRMAPTECLIEGIENLQLEFGIDENGDRRADRFDRRPGPGELASAVAARIYLLVRSIHPLPGHVDDKSYSLGATRIAATNDAYYRRVMQTTVLLRNTGLFRP